MKRYYVYTILSQIFISSCSSTIFDQDELFLKYDKNSSIDYKKASFYFELKNDVKKNKKYEKYRTHYYYEDETYLNDMISIKNKIEGLFKKNNFVISSSRKDCDILVSMKFKGFYRKLRDNSNNIHNEYNGYNKNSFDLESAVEGIKLILGERTFEYILNMKYKKRKPKKYAKNTFLEYHIKISAFQGEMMPLDDKFTEIFEIFNIK